MVALKHHFQITFAFISLLSCFHCEKDIAENSMLTDRCPNVKTTLPNLRKRRHITFPDGSNYVITISLVKAFMTHVPSGWNTVIEIDVMFPLPNSNATNKFFRRKLHHKQKREVWERIMHALEFHNINGRACILRSICEAKKYLAPPGISLVHDILRAIFTAPIHEKDFTRELSDFYVEFEDENFCDILHECPFSLIDFVLSLNKQK